MSSKNTAFYRDNKAITFDFSGEEVSSDAGLLLLYKMARKNKLIKSFSRLIPDPRNQLLITYKQEDLLLSRVLLLACGYEDASDYTYLSQDPILDIRSLVWRTESICSLYIAWAYGGSTAMLRVCQQTSTMWSLMWIVRMIRLMVISKAVCFTAITGNTCSMSCSGEITIEYPAALNGILQVNFFTITRQLQKKLDVKTSERSTNKIHFNLQDLPPGLYFLAVSDRKNSRSFKVILN